MNIKTILFSFASVIGLWVTFPEPARAVKFGFSSEAKLTGLRFYNVKAPTITPKKLPQGEEIYFLTPGYPKTPGDVVGINGVDYNITDENGIGAPAFLTTYNGTLYLQNGSQPAGYCIDAETLVIANALNLTSLPVNTNSANSVRTDIGGPYYFKNYTTLCSQITLNIGDNGLPKPVPDVFTFFSIPFTQALTSEGKAAKYTISSKFPIFNDIDTNNAKRTFAPKKFSESEKEIVYQELEILGFGESLTPDSGVITNDPSYTFPFDPFADCSTPGVTCVTRDDFETVPESSNSLALLVVFSVIATIPFIRKYFYLVKRPTTK
jgi:hypothetical protein